MGFDVAAYRRAAERLEKMGHDINPSIAAVLILQLCDEIERLQQHRCLWGNDPSGPHYSDEYLESLETLSDTVAALPMAPTVPSIDEIVGWVDRFYGFAFDGWTHKDFTFRDDCSADFIVRFGNASPRRFVLVSKDAFATLDKISAYEKDDPTEKHGGEVMNEPIPDDKPYAVFVFNHEGRQYVAREDYERLRAEVVKHEGQSEHTAATIASLRTEVRTLRQEVAALREERRMLIDADQPPGVTR